MMKAGLLVAAVAATLTTAEVQAVNTEARQDLTAIGAIAVGAVAGGPLGAMAGALSGAWLAEQVGRADRLEESEDALADMEAAQQRSREQVARLESELESARSEQQRLLAMSLQELQLAMLFRTGESDLARDGEQRLALLADYLRANPRLRVHLSGFADPRGDAAENMKLAEARAERVAAGLEAAGVSAARIRVTAHGESQSSAATGDMDAYALERRVTIELSPEADVAQGGR